MHSSRTAIKYDAITKYKMLNIVILDYVQIEDSDENLCLILNIMSYGVTKTFLCQSITDSQISRTNFHTQSHYKFT